MGPSVSDLGTWTQARRRALILGSVTPLNFILQKVRSVKWHVNVTARGQGAKELAGPFGVCDDLTSHFVLATYSSSWWKVEGAHVGHT